MKLLVIFLIAAVALASAQGPSKIHSNNVGDIVNVDVKARAKIDNQVDATIVGVLIRFLNWQAIQLNRDNDSNNDDGPPQWPNLPNLPNLPGPRN